MQNKQEEMTRTWTQINVEHHLKYENITIDDTILCHICCAQKNAARQPPNLKMSIPNSKQGRAENPEQLGILYLIAFELILSELVKYTLLESWKLNVDNLNCHRLSKNACGKIIISA